MAARQNPTDAQKARAQLAARYAKDAELADAQAAMAPNPSVAAGASRAAARARKRVATAKRMGG